MLAQQEQNQLIWSALEKIPEKYRVPLVLFYRSGQSLTEIANALELSKEVLSMRLTRARKYLRRELEKHVEGTIAASGPGELFSLAVIAALPAIATLSTTGKAAAAALAGGTVLGAETTFAASSMVVTPKPGPSSVALFGMASFGITGTLLLGLVSMTFFALFFLLAAIPGVWFSVRNAPTLRTRRYLILCSLRAHLLIAFFAFLVWAFFPSCDGILALIKYCGIDISSEMKWAYIINSLFSYGSFALLCIGVAFLFFVSPWIYRRILREDTGLAQVERPLSTHWGGEGACSLPPDGRQPTFTQLEKTYKRFSTACLVMLIWFFVIVPFSIFCRAVGIVQEGFQWNFGYFHDRYGVWCSFLLVGLVFYIVFRKLHRQLMETANDAATFHAVGPAWERNKTPFGERVFVEWLVYFGCFVAAGLIVASKPAFGYSDWTPYYPIPMSLKLALILGGSFAFAAINAVFPKFRWLVILGGCLLVGNRIEWIFRHPTWDYGRNVAWFDSPSDWSVLFGIIFLNIYVVLAVFATLILAGLHYYAKWNGGANRRAIRFSLPKKAAIVYGVLGALLLCAAPWGYSSLQVPYWTTRSVFLNDDAKKLELCNEVLRLENNIHSRNSQSALLRRARVYENQKQYALALAEYDAIISSKPVDFPAGRGSWIYGWRADVKFLLGDLHGAIADYTEAYTAIKPEARIDIACQRGFAYEKLGETEKAVADYTVAIDNAIEFKKRFPQWRRFDSPVPREGCADPNRITLDELKSIRDKLLEEERIPLIPKM